MSRLVYSVTVVSLIVAVFSGCRENAASAPEKTPNSDVSPSTQHSPTFEFDKAAQAAIQSLGDYDEVFLVRWSTGTVEGFVELEIDGAVKQINITDPWSDTADETHQAVPPGGRQGVLLVTLKKAAGETADYRQLYDVNVRTAFSGGGVTFPDRKANGQLSISQNLPGASRWTSPSPNSITMFKGLDPETENQRDDVVRSPTGGGVGVPWLQVRDTSVAN